jgi:coenzyme PQQ synthesis protein D (PqqD)
MTEKNNTILPQARHKDLLVQELPDELLVYDLESHRAHCLNRTAALVWKRCDGRASFSDVAMDLSNEVRVPIDEDVVRLALQQLDEAHLLVGPVEPRSPANSLSRRRLIKGIGLAAAIPLVTSLTAPIIHAGVSSCTLACATSADCQIITPVPAGCTPCCNNGSVGPPGLCVAPTVVVPPICPGG